MKKYINISILVVFALILSFGVHQHKLAVEYRNRYSISKGNEEAYNTSISKDKSKANVYQTTISDLRQSNDSLIQELLKVQKEKKVKNSNVQSMSYQVSTVSKKDTITLRDTIFKTNINIDTTLTDKWYTLNLKLKYPSNIIVAPSFKSERYIIVSTKKEYLNTPSKLFFIRWFQRKHTVLEVNIQEKNPYITIDDQKFIKVLK